MFSLFTPGKKRKLGLSEWRDFDANELVFQSLKRAVGVMLDLTQFERERRKDDTCRPVFVQPLERERTRPTQVQGLLE